MRRPQAHGSSPQANHRWNMRNEQYMGEIFTNICGVDNKCRQSFGIYQSFGGEA
ncbi:unnamed protein product [Brassica napus]|uniref:(rape) hypothetical protein n=1 Tax=Brassica napus TaxID=3708 RepID=A0A816KVD1_BRANA|nr:unnamed protein product [Brassica napus]